MVRTQLGLSSRKLLGGHARPALSCTKTNRLYLYYGRTCLGGAKHTVFPCDQNVDPTLLVVCRACVTGCTDALRSVLRQAANSLVVPITKVVSHGLSRAKLREAYKMNHFNVEYTLTVTDSTGLSSTGT